MKIPVVGVNVSAGMLALGAVGVLLAPRLIPMAANLLRSATKTGMKGGMIAYDKGREFVSGTVVSLHHHSEQTKNTGAA